MSLYMEGTVDPIAVRGVRQINYLPSYFTVINLSKHLTTDFLWDSKPIKTWIWTHLSGRFYFESTSIYNADSRNIKNSELIVGFEDSSEAVMFMLILSSFSD